MNEQDSHEVIELLNHIKEELESIRTILEAVKDHFEIMRTQ